MSSKDQDSQQVVYMMHPSESGDGIDFFELVSIVWHRKWTIFSVTTAFAIAGVIYSLLATPIYRSEVVLIPAQSEQGSNIAERLGGLASLAGINLGGSTSNGQHALAIFRSRAFIEDFINDNDLLPILFVDQWDAEKELWIDENPENWPNTVNAVRFFSETVRSISEDIDTGLVTLTIEWTDPVIATQWAEVLVERINERLRARDLADSERRLEYLNTQLEKASLVELRQAISSLIEDQVQTIMLAQAEEEYAFKVIDPPRVPNERISPRRKLIVFISALLGGMVAVFSTILTYLFRNRDYGVT